MCANFQICTLTINRRIFDEWGHCLFVYLFDVTNKILLKASKSKYCKNNEATFIIKNRFGQYLFQYFLKFVPHQEIINFRLMQKHRGRQQKFGFRDQRLVHTWIFQRPKQLINAVTRMFVLIARYGNDNVCDLVYIRERLPSGALFIATWDR